MADLRVFQSGTVDLPGLEAKATLKPNQFYRDDGVVPDLKEHTQRIIQAFGGLESDLFANGEDASVGGHCLHLKFQEGLEACAVFYEDFSKPSFSDWVAPYVQAHEESHMLHKFGLTDILQDEINQAGYDLDLTKHLSNEELIACIGGFVGASKKGITVDYADVENNPDMSQAHRLLNGRQPETALVVSERNRTQLDRGVDTGGYQDFQGLRFRVIDLSTSDAELETHVPTYIKMSTGDLDLKAYAPTIIEGCTGRIAIDAYAPMLIRGSTRPLKAYFRDNTAIEGLTGDLDITASPYLDAIISPTTHNLNGQLMAWKSASFRAPEESRGQVLVKGCTGNINFEYDGQSKLFLPKSSYALNVMNKVKALLGR